MLSLKCWAQLKPEDISVFTNSYNVTFRELYQLCSHTVAGLCEATKSVSDCAESNGLEGHVFAFEAQPDLESIVLLHALLEAGAVALPLSPRLTQGERAHLLQLSGGVLLERRHWGWSVAQTDLPNVPDVAHRSALSSTKVLAPRAPLSSRVRTLSAAAPPTSPPLLDDRRSPSATPNRPQVLIATSGSSGPSKLVQLSRSALEASARASAEYLQMRSTDRWLLSLNPAHIGGYSILLRCLYVGAAVVLDDDARHPDRLSVVVERHRVTHLSLVPTQLLRWLAQSPRPRPTSLRTALIGGAACPTTLLGRARKAGIPALATYGMSEACAQITAQPLTDLDEPEVRPDSGLPVGATELKIVDGALRIRGSTLFDGYRTHPFPEECRPALDEDGWFETQDLGELTAEGRFVPLGRRQDRIVTGGENVSPAEVEAALLDLPEVALAVVVGLPDHEWGQIVVAALERESHPTSDDDTWFAELALALRRKLAGYKCPKRWLRLPNIPRLPSGKVDRLAIIGIFEQKTNDG